MAPFRILLITLFLCLASYAAILAASGQFDFVTPILSSVPALTWQGHLNLDFLSYLVLAGTWIAWRSGFTASGIAVGVLSTMLGMMFFAPYALYLISRSNNDPRKLLLGVHTEN